jgi:hypothetical protein
MRQGGAISGNSSGRSDQPVCWPHVRLWHIASVIAARRHVRSWLPTSLLYEGSSLIIRLRRSHLRCKRHQQSANESFGTPIKQRLSTKLRLNTGDDASGAKSPGRGLVNHRAAAFFPYQCEDIVFLYFPCDRYAPGLGRERTKFGRIGQEFMESQRQNLRRCGLQLNLGTTDLDLAGHGVWCELLVDQPLNFCALPTG